MFGLIDGKAGAEIGGEKKERVSHDTRRTEGRKKNKNQVHMCVVHFVYVVLVVGGESDGRSSLLLLTSFCAK